MPIELNGRQYTTVAERLDQFRQKHTFEDGWAITEQIVEFVHDDYVIVRCEIENAEGRVIGVGHAHERFLDSDINMTSAVECASTSALGRALASLGYHGTEICSAQELFQAKHAQEQLKKTGGGNVKGQAALSRTKTYGAIAKLINERSAEDPKLDSRWIEYCRQVKKAYERVSQLDAPGSSEAKTQVEQWLEDQRKRCREVTE